jgi:TRAP-type C4-dicarboxylate transport system substrate-binding protein
MVVMMNKKKWNSLREAAKKVIDQVANEAFGLKAAAAFDQEDLDNIALGKEKGIQFHKLPEAEQGKVRNQIKGIWAEWVAKNAKQFPAQEILDAVLASAKANN